MQMFLTVPPPTKDRNTDVQLPRHLLIKLDQQSSKILSRTVTDPPSSVGWPAIQNNKPQNKPGSIGLEK